MSVDWEPYGAEMPGSMMSYGRRLRASRGGVMAGLDQHMISLLEKLFEIPRPDPKESDPAHDYQPAPSPIQN